MSSSLRYITLNVAWFKKSAESRPTRIDTDTKYETGIDSVETWYNSVKLGELGRVPKMTQ